MDKIVQQKLLAGVLHRTSFIDNASLSIKLSTTRLVVLDPAASQACGSRASLGLAANKFCCGLMGDGHAALLTAFAVSWVPSHPDKPDTSGNPSQVVLFQHDYLAPSIRHYDL